MAQLKDMITNNNVIKTYQEGKHLCFVLRNGMVVKLNPNEAGDKGGKRNKEEKC